MIIFQNKGLIDLAAVRTMGVSVKRPGSFGYFGTGLKFGIASVLRGGGRIELWRGTDHHKFTTRPETIRGEVFNLVLMDGEPMGFTDQLGKNWEPWMVLRELGCNAKDEGGSFRILDLNIEVADLGTQEDVTTFAVEWDALETAFKDRDSVFCGSEVLYETPHVEVRAGSSPHLFYRGVRAYKLEKSSRFTYNILDEQRLSEDRSLVSRYYADQAVIRSLLICEDRTILDAVLTTGKGFYEGNLDFTGEEDLKPCRPFIDTIMDAKDRRDHGLSESARKLLSKFLRQGAEQETAGYYRTRESVFSSAIIALDNLGINLQDQTVILIEELDGGGRSLLEDDRIYLLRELAENGPVREVAWELIMCHLEKECYGRDDTAELLVPLLFKTQHALQTTAEAEEDRYEPLEYKAASMEEMTGEQAEVHSQVEEMFDPTGEDRAAHDAAWEF